MDTISQVITELKDAMLTKKEVNPMVELASMETMEKKIKWKNP